MCLYVPVKQALYQVLLTLLLHFHTSVNLTPGLFHLELEMDKWIQRISRTGLQLVADLAWKFTNDCDGKQTYFYSNHVLNKHNTRIHLCLKAEVLVCCPGTCGQGRCLDLMEYGNGKLVFYVRLIIGIDMECFTNIRYWPTPNFWYWYQPMPIAYMQAFSAKVN